MRPRKSDLLPGLIFRGSRKKTFMTKQLTVFFSARTQTSRRSGDRVLDAVRRLPFQYDALEFLGARTGLHIETFLAEIRRSDVLVVVTDHRYGSLMAGAGEFVFVRPKYPERQRLGNLVYVRRERTSTSKDFE
jgi:hypothetical protein